MTARFTLASAGLDWRNVKKFVTPRYLWYFRFTQTELKVVETITEV